MSRAETLHLFLLVPNDSCSTWLQNNLSLCSNCVAFLDGRTGKGIGAGANYANSGVYPNQEINKLFSEDIPLWSTPGAFDWEIIKTNWHAAWSKHEHYQTANPRVYLEKAPNAIYASDMYVDHFDNVRFIIMTRNPYAVAEGMWRTINRPDVPIERCIKHWVKCAKRQIYNYETYKDIAIEITYEELVGDPRAVEQKIRQFIPALQDIDFTKAVRAHTLDGMKAQPLLDLNERHIRNLTPGDTTLINAELEQVPEVLEYFGYEIL
jgi:hypothetical protein